MKDKKNKYGVDQNGAPTKTEAEIIGRLKMLGGRRAALVQQMQQFEAQAQQVRTAAIQTEGAINEIAERLYAGPYTEIFAGRQYPGWTCLGNESGGAGLSSRRGEPSNV